MRRFKFLTKEMREDLDAKLKSGEVTIADIRKNTCNCRQEDIRIKNLLGVLGNDECVLYFNYTAVTVEEVSNVAFDCNLLFFNHSLQHTWPEDGNCI